MIEPNQHLALNICQTIDWYSRKVGHDLTGSEVLGALEQVRYEITEALIKGHPEDWGPRVLGRGQQRGPTNI